MSKDVIGLAFEVGGRLVQMIGRIVQLRDENAALKALRELDAVGRRVDAREIALEAARAVRKPEPEDS